jgi:hypothetical protein
MAVCWVVDVPDRRLRRVFGLRRQPANPWVDPIVVASVTRTGSTLLQQLLSVHPELTIWGEHFGVLSRLRDALEALDDARDQLQAGYDQHRLLLDGSFAGIDLSPQVNPFDVAGFEDAARRFVLDLFRSELPPTSRWGFKEVHYFTSDLEFLLRLFPGTKFIVLVRRPEGQISSYARAPWRKYPRGESERREAVAEVVRTAAKNWTAKYGELHRFATAHPERTLVVRYEDLVTGVLDLDGLFAHCGLDTPDRSALDATTARRSFSSDGTPGWDASARAHLDELIASTVFPPEHESVMAYFYAETDVVSTSRVDAGDAEPT